MLFKNNSFIHDVHKIFKKILVFVFVFVLCSCFVYFKKMEKGAGIQCSQVHGMLKGGGYLDHFFTESFKNNILSL